MNGGNNCQCQKGDKGFYIKYTLNKKGDKGIPGPIGPKGDKGI